MSTNYTVSSDVDTMLRSATNAQIRSNIGAGSETQVNINATNISSIGEQVDINVDDISTLQTDIDAKAPKNNPDFTGDADFDNITASGNITGSRLTSTGQLVGSSLNITYGATVKNLTAEQVSPSVRMVVGEIKCNGNSVAFAQPINYLSNEHRFKDFDGNPDDLMVIEKVNGYTGARIGINRDQDDNPNAKQAALHVVAGRKTSDPTDFDLGLRVGQGGAYFDKYIRVGHYTDNERDNIQNEYLGQVIYNTDHNEFQGFMINNGQREWRAFQMTNVST